MQKVSMTSSVPTPFFHINYNKLKKSINSQKKPNTKS